MYVNVCVSASRIAWQPTELARRIFEGRTSMSHWFILLTMMQSMSIGCSLASTVSVWGWEVSCRCSRCLDTGIEMHMGHHLRDPTKVPYLGLNLHCLVCSR